MAYQSLYLLYRPKRFSEIKGQDHVVRALQTAVRDNKVGHAYLLHGPRGSGKTSTARVLAKALNCENLDSEGEPCCVCESCVSIQENRSFDLQELDAASNNKVDDMRTLLERVNLASPGRAKVYLLDEVHMLTPGAENALLKTLEEPPSHVTWVLATTEPHKVAQTIRSRCQVFELGLVDADLMGDHVRYIIEDAELDVGEGAVDHVVAAGGGSVRDTLSALDRVAAGGMTTELDSSVDSILVAIADRDRARALSAVGEATGRGRDPRTIGEMVLAGLRDAFLTAMGDPPSRTSEHERARAADLAQRMAPAAITRALETLGRALVDMRQAPDPRVDIEVALVRLCQLDEERSLEALMQRVRLLEERLGVLPADHSDPPDSEEPPEQAPPPAAPAPPEPAVEPPSEAAPRRRPAGVSPAQAARESLGPRPAVARPRPGPRTQPAPASSENAAPPPPVPGRDPAALKPQTAREVVELAGRHLGLSREHVVARASELLPAKQSGPRRPEELLVLWKDLVAGSSTQRPAPEQTRPEPPAPREPAPEPDPVPVSESDPAPDPVPASESDPAPDPVPASDPAPDPVPASEPAREPDPVLASESDPVSDPVLASEPAREPDPVPASEPAREPDPVPASEPEPEPGLEPPLEPGLEPEAAAGAVFDEDTDFEAEDMIDVDDLVEAPSHAAGIEAKILQAFPGSEMEMLPESGGEATP